MKKKPIVIHPLLFAVYPILFLYAHNIDLGLGTQFLRPMLIVTGAMLVFWLALAFAFRSKEKGGLLVSIFLVLFFSYGHINNLLGDFAVEIASISLGKSEALLLAQVFVFTASAYCMTKVCGDLSRVTNILNFIGATLVVLTLINIAGHKGNDAAALETVDVTGPPSGESHIAKDDLPNIYYIILDGYAREDILESVYDYDNSQFLNRLSDRGFFIANRSRSNYAQTILSLASSLNFHYLDDAAAKVGNDSENRAPLMQIIQKNDTVSFLRKFGYQFIGFDAGYWGVQMRGADKYMHSNAELSEFEKMWLNTTPIMDVLYALRLYDPWEVHRNRILFNLEHVVDIAELDSPAFVFVHILSPHPPFVFGQNGQKIDQRSINPNRYFIYADGLKPEWGLDLEEYKDSYIAQLDFINKRVEVTIEGLLSKSKVPPIIILQADHGPSSGLDSDLANPNSANLKERMSILNAYYLPKESEEQLYPDISPVNTFRVILNGVFDAQYKLLDDESYFSTWKEPYKFTNVTGALDREESRASE